MARSLARIAALLLALAPAAAARAGGKPPAAGEPPPPKLRQLTPAQRGFGPARAMFAEAVECRQDRRCSEAEVEDAEDRFVAACRGCDTEERCEAARKAIRAGESTRDMKLCE